MWEKNNAVQRTAAEAAAKVRFKAESKRAKREREKAEEWTMMWLRWRKWRRR